ncbi:DMT family transporter [Amycolatopsis nigrescens]|uniref:DMT family transporter n=1 Tax=Amycolatopsis nigrescens TaxID=381445 RepID=UPI00035E3B81|nr:DMT family transporter [Amycolatopsis nigrescens]
MDVVALLAAGLFIGCLLAVQASVNLQLSNAVKTPYGASTLQLTVATVLLAVLAVAVGTIGAVQLIGDVEWWHLLGGLASPLYITSGILLFPRLGALTAVGLFVTGQMFASLALDLFGLIGVARQPLTIGMVLGALAVLAGITVIIRGQQAAAAKPKPAPQSVGAMHKPAVPVGHVGWILLGLIAGAVLPIQGAVNAKLRQDLQAPITVAMISFIVATLTIVVVLALMRASRRTPAPQLRPLKRMPWWGWLGGACAATYVTGTFLLIPEIGAATTVALAVTGQQAASALIDGFGWFRMPKRTLTPPRLIGLSLLIVGSILVQLA